MSRHPKPRRDRYFTRPALQEAATYLMNADEIATMSSHFAMQAVSVQARRVAGHFEKGSRGAEEASLYRE
jgi:hypothetical protein